jgi:cell division protein FtsA
MARKIAVGIDIGTYQVKVVVSEYIHDDNSAYPQIIATGLAESKGLRHGYIVNERDITASIQQAVAEAEKVSGIPIRKAYLAIGGVGLESVVSSGSTVISRADYEITDLDVERVFDESQSKIPQPSILNRKVLHRIPIQYKIDGKVVLGRPAGMKGMKLEVKTLFITCLEQHLNDLIQAVENAGIEVLSEIASPIAASLVTLSKAQKKAGCVLANIGAETVSIIVYEDSTPISLEVFPIGSTDITHDIALGLKIPIEDAEEIKLGAITPSSFPKKKLEEIVTARLSDIFELIEAHLKKIGRDGLLPAGIIITGGGSGISTIDELARAVLRLPSRIGGLESFDFRATKVRDATWAVAYGLCIMSFTEKQSQSSGNNFIAEFIKSVLRWFKQFLP